MNKAKKIVAKIYGDTIKIDAHNGVMVSDAAAIICTMLNAYVDIPRDKDSIGDLIEMRSWMFQKVTEMNAKISEVVE